MFPADLPQHTHGTPSRVDNCERELNTYRRLLHHGVTCVPRCFGIVRIPGFTDFARTWIPLMRLSRPPVGLLLEWIDAIPMPRHPLWPNVSLTAAAKEAISALREIHGAGVLIGPVDRYNVIAQKKLSGGRPVIKWVGFSNAVPWPRYGKVTPRSMDNDQAQAWEVLGKSAPNRVFPGHGR